MSYETTANLNREIAIEAIQAASTVYESWGDGLGDKDTDPAPRVIALAERLETWIHDSRKRGVSRDNGR